MFFGKCSPFVSFLSNVTREMFYVFAGVKSNEDCRTASSFLSVFSCLTNYKGCIGMHLLHPSLLFAPYTLDIDLASYPNHPLITSISFFLRVFSAYPRFRLMRPKRLPELRADFV